jgi:hypothetical protein
LTSHVGFIRLAHLKCPKSGKPDFGWSIVLRKMICAKGMDCRVKPGNDGTGKAARFAQAGEYWSVSRAQREPKASGAPQTRDRYKHRLREGPGSAAHRHSPRRRA